MQVSARRYTPRRREAPPRAPQGLLRSAWCEKNGAGGAEKPLALEGGSAPNCGEERERGATRTRGAVMVRGALRPPPAAACWGGIAAWLRAQILTSCAAAGTQPKAWSSEGPRCESAAQWEASKCARGPHALRAESRALLFLSFFSGILSVYTTVCIAIQACTPRCSVPLCNSQ